MRLREAGRLHLDDAVGRYVGGLHRSIAEATIAQLLSHSAGLVRDGWDSGQLAALDQLRNRVARQRHLPRLLAMSAAGQTGVLLSPKALARFPVAVLKLPAPLALAPVAVLMLALA